MAPTYDTTMSNRRQAACPLGSVAPDPLAKRGAAGTSPTRTCAARSGEAILLRPASHPRLSTHDGLRPAPAMSHTPFSNRAGTNADSLARV
ncbi:hypothetical protein ES703_48960 [subsurface metagenome]